MREAMETLEYRDVVDKSEWDRGPWDNEPDKVQWRDDATGLPCLIVRGPMGGWCGYVGVPEGHPWHGKGYDECPANVHGGLTFASACSHGDQDKSICHVPAPGESDNVWWLGFDCAHFMDLSPGMTAYRAVSPRLRNPGTYRDSQYVMDEVRDLAAQVAHAAKVDPK